MDEALLEQIVTSQKDKLQAPVDVLYEIMGFAALCRWSDTFGGSTLYVPKRLSMFRPCLEAEMISEFTGDNYKILGRKFGFCEATVRKILGREYGRG